MDKIYKISKQTSWQILGKIVTSLCTFIILGVVARNYGQDGTGLFTLALTYLAMFYLLADFGFNAHVLRKFQVSSFKFQVEWQKLLGIRLVWSGILVILAIALLPFLPFKTPAFSLSVILGAPAIILSGIFVSSNLIFQKELRYDLSIFSSSFGTVMGLLIFLLLIFYKYPIPLLLFAHFWGWFFIALSSLLLIRKLLKVMLPIFDVNYATGLFKQSWPIAATLTLNVVYFRVDSFMVAYFKSISEAGVYNLAYSVFQTALVLPTFIMNSYYPLMLRSLGGIRIIIFGLLGLSIFGTLLTLVLSPLIINILSGGGFEGSVTSLRILSLGFPAYFLSSLLMWFLIGKGSYKRVFMIYTLGTIFNILTNFIFIPKFSFYAASWVTVISEYLILGMQVYIVTNKRRRG